MLTCDLGKGTIRLHDVLRSYLVQRAGPKLPALHARILDVSQQVLGLKRWADLPPNDAYLWQHLILHLCPVNSHLRQLHINHEGIFCGLPVFSTLITWDEMIAVVPYTLKLFGNN